MNQIDVSHTIIAKSDQLNALDLPPSETIVKITAVKVLDNKEQPVHLHLEGHDGRPYKPCLSMRRILINAWGQYAEKWIGRSMSLYCDQSVKWAGKDVGGIRIARLSNIDRSVSAPIALNRSMREMYTVDPLAVADPLPIPAQLAACSSMVSLQALWATLTPAEKTENEAAKESKKAELTA